MALTAAEEETIDSLKKWWDENGKRLVILVIAVMAGYTSWLLWQNSRIDQASAASDMYEEILSLAAIGPGETTTAQDRDRILELAAQLREDHADTIYARFAALFGAQQSVRNDDLQGAADALQWIVDNRRDGLLRDEEEGLVLTASLRLGRVLLSQQRYDEALALVNSVDPGAAFESGFSELRGDIYYAMGRLVDARDAYEAAQQAGSQSDGLRMKLEDLGNES